MKIKSKGKLWIILSVVTILALGAVGGVLIFLPHKDNTTTTVNLTTTVTTNVIEYSTVKLDAVGEIVLNRLKYQLVSSFKHLFLSSVKSMNMFIGWYYNNDTSLLFVTLLQVT